MSDLAVLIAELEARVRKVTHERDRLRVRVAELEAVNKAKDGHIEARAAERDYYVHRVEELTAALRTVLDNVLIPGRAGVVAPDDYNAARAVLDAVQAPGHVPPCSHAARVAELEPREQARTDHGYVPGCSCPGCDPRGAAKRIAELEDAARQCPTYELRKRLRRLADATEPYVTGRPEASHGQAMANESALAVAWRAAQPVLGEAHDGHGGVLVDLDHLSLLVGALTESDMLAFSPEVRAAVNAAEAALQVADGRGVEFVQAGDAL